VIDLHCHLLPGLDDGPETLSGALEMARAAVATGTTVMVATPHIDEHWGVRPMQVAERAATLVGALDQEGIELEVLTGGELDLTRMANLTSEELDTVRLGKGPYLLIEAPLSPSADGFDMVVERIHARGESILLAHPERSPLFQRHPERLVRLVQRGVLCSITAGSIVGRFGESVRAFTLELLRGGLAHDIASDSHDHLRRPPGIGEALLAAEAQIAGVAGQLDWFTRLAPAAMLAGEPLPAKPALAL
jgi:protein-tyrosine phosphatase